MKHNFKRLGLLLGLGLASGIVGASPCGPVGTIPGTLASYQTAYLAAANGGFFSFSAPANSNLGPALLSTNNPYLAAGYLLSFHPECFGGSTATAQVQINGTSFQLSNAITRSLGLRFGSDNPGPFTALESKGMAAGNAGKKWNIWGSVDANTTNQSYLAANNWVTNNDSRIWNSVIGIDYTLSPMMVAGVSVAIDRGSTSGLNGNPADLKKEIDTDGYTIAPYIGYQISKALFFDASLGIGRGNMSSNSATDSKSDRRFGAANLGYEHWVGNFQLTGKVSYLRGVEDYGNINSKGISVVGTAAKNTLGQVRLAAQAGYWMNGVMPYASLGYVDDIERKTTQFGALIDPIGKHAWFWSLGANFISLSSGVTAGLSYKQEAGRSNQENKVFMSNLAFRF